MKPEHQILFTPFKIASCEIKNRFVMEPMGGTHLINWYFNKGYEPHVHDLYVERAKDGVGLIVTGASPVYSFMQGGDWLYNHPEAFEGIRELMDEVHSYGTKVFVQFTAGAGRCFPQPANYEETFGKMLDLDRVNASPDAGIPNRWTPDFKSQKITVDEIHDIVHAFGKTAAICKELGIDGINVHALHEGYLLDEFAMSYTNHRDDEYGGSMENRCRFAAEIVKEIKKTCGDDYPVTIRLSVESRVRDIGKGIIPQDNISKEIGRTMAESIEAVRILTEAGYDAFDCDNGTYDSWYWAHPPVYMEQNCNLSYAKALRPHTTAVIGCAGRMQPDDAAMSIKNGEIDYVGIARQFLTDERFITKLREGHAEQVRPCISCHLGCMPIGMSKGTGSSYVFGQETGVCALNPRTLHEKEYTFSPSASPKKFAVIGGGVAGMEFALKASQCGHQVTIYEKTGKLGGMFITAAAMTFKEKDRELLDWYRMQIEASDVEVICNTEITSLDGIEADHFIIATGHTKARELSIPGSEKAVSAVAYLNSKSLDGDNVVIIGGGITGCEIAYELCLAGKHPVIVEMMSDIMAAPGLSMANTSFLRDAFDFYHVPIYTESKASEITGDRVIIETSDGTVGLKADKIVVSMGYLGGSPLAASDASNVHLLGDAKKVANLRKAIWDADKLVKELA